MNSEAGELCLVAHGVHVFVKRVWFHISNVLPSADPEGGRLLRHLMRAICSPDLRVQRLSMSCEKATACSAELTLEAES